MLFVFLNWAHVHELSWGHWHIVNNWKSSLSVFLTTYILRSSYFCTIRAASVVLRVISNKFCFFRLDISLV